MPRASEENRTIPEKIAELFGGEPTVTRHYDRDENHEVDVAKRADCPLPGVNSYSTLNLSDYPLIRNGEESKTGVEILTADYSGFEYLANAISTAAFHIIKDQWFCAPGYAFPNILDKYDSDILLPHLYFTAQFFWDKNAQTVRVPGKTVSFLQAIPISEGERQYVVQHGDTALLVFLGDNDANIFDLTREPVL